MEGDDHLSIWWHVPTRHAVLRRLYVQWAHNYHHLIQSIYRHMWVVFVYSSTQVILVNYLLGVRVVGATIAVMSSYSQREHTITGFRSNPDFHGCEPCALLLRCSCNQLQQLALPQLFLISFTAKFMLPQLGCSKFWISFRAAALFWQFNVGVEQWTACIQIFSAPWLMMPAILVFFRTCATILFSTFLVLG